MKNRILFPVVFCLPGFSISDSHQPLPDLYKSWKKDGASDNDVKAALLSCGYKDPYTGIVSNISLNTRAGYSLCMQNKGYRYLFEPIICEQNHQVPLRACTEKKG